MDNKEWIGVHALSRHVGRTWAKSLRLKIGLKEQVFGSNISFFFLAGFYVREEEGESI